MFAPRLVLASLLSVLLAGLSSAVTFSPEFEKTLEAGLNKLKQDIQEYPKLQTAVDGIPMDVAGWEALSRDDIVATLKFFSNQKTNALQNLLITDPANAKNIEKFTMDTHDVIMNFADEIKAGTFTSAPAASTPAPTTAAPEAAKTPEVTTAAPTTTTAVTEAPTTAASSAMDTSLSGSAGEAVAEETTPVTTKPASAAPVPAPTSAASVVATITPAVLGAVAAVFFAVY